MATLWQIGISSANRETDIVNRQGVLICTQQKLPSPDEHHNHFGGRFFLSLFTKDDYYSECQTTDKLDFELDDCTDIFEFRSDR